MSPIAAVNLGPDSADGLYRVAFPLSDQTTKVGPTNSGLSRDIRFPGPCRGALMVLGNSSR